MNLPPRPIVVLGSVNMDLIGAAGHFPQPGETVLGGRLQMTPGGKGGNQAVAAARAGGAVQLLAAVGADDFGVALTDHLRSEGVATDRVRRTDGASGVALIVVDAAGENTIVVLPGANAALTDLTEPERALIADGSVLVCQLEIPVATVTEAARVAAAAGVPVLLNPSPAGAALPAELLAAVTLAVVNRGEADALGAAALTAIPHLVTTLGSGGAQYRGPDGVVIAVPAPRVAAVDTTGAGDAFTGALSVSWARRHDPVTALRRACAAGALATTRPGAGGAAPTAAEIDTLVATRWWESAQPPG